MAKMKKKNSSKLGLLVSVFMVIGLAIGGIYVYHLPEFEKIKPTIEGPNNIYWNRTDPLKIILKDNVGLKNFKLILSDGKKSVIIGKGNFSDRTKKQILLVKYPKGKILNQNATKLTLNVIATDKSMWNMMKGNTTQKIFKIHVDSKRPNVNILANSRMINQGGSALVIFQADDENLDELYIEADGNKFKPQPYKKNGYYASLIAWPFSKNTFFAKIVAIDLAKNKRIKEIPFYHANPAYKTSYIRASDKFIDGKITELASNNAEYAKIDDRLEKLKAINETMRLNNEKRIHKLSKIVSDKLLDSWKIKKFYPLKNAKKVASFGDHRYYYYKNKNHVVSQSYHVGYDMASTKMANIKSSNAGQVVYADENGIYGNMPMINHGLGLYTLYGHCSEILVKEGDEVNAGEVIAKTGKTGLALGDHLHFGILVQGVEVRPVEWFDQHWINKFIDNVFKEADKIIGEKNKKIKKRVKSK